jgi:hypothetical protein
MGHEMQGIRRNGLDAYQQPAFQAGMMLDQTMRLPSQVEAVLRQQPALPPGWPYNESASRFPHAAGSPQLGASVLSRSILSSPQRSPLLAPLSHPQQQQRILSLVQAGFAPQLLLELEGQRLEGGLARERLKRKREAVLPKAPRSLLIQERSDRKGLAASNFPLPRPPGVPPAEFSHEGLLDRYMSTWTQLDTQTAVALGDDQATTPRERSRFVRERFSHAMHTNAVNFLGHPVIHESEEDSGYGSESEEEDGAMDN